MSRSSRAFRTTAVNFTAIPAATTAGAAQVLPARDAGARAILNTSTGIMRVYLCDLATKQGGRGESYRVPAGATWEDPANYTGPITLEWVTADGPANCTEWE